MKTVKISINGQTSKLSDAVFDLNDEKQAENLFNLFRELSANYITIHTPELSVSKEAPKDLVGSISVEVTTLKMEKTTTFLDPTFDRWSKDSTEDFRAVLDLTPDNIKFVTMLSKLAMNDSVISKMSHTAHVK